MCSYQLHTGSDTSEHKQELTWLTREDMVDPVGSTTSRKVRFTVANGITSYC